MSALNTQPPSASLPPAGTARVQAGERRARNGHPGMVIWLTGLSGSGKSTLSRALERELFAQGRQVCALDGDELRQGLTSDLGFSREARGENIRRVAEVAALFSRAGLIAITACISPYRADREMARRVAQQAGATFVEVYLDTPLEVCEGRDVKGLYKRARAGEIAEFTGINAPYEVPENPEVRVPTGAQSVETSVAAVVRFLEPSFTEVAS